MIQASPHVPPKGRGNGPEEDGGAGGRHEPDIGQHARLLDDDDLGGVILGARGAYALKHEDRSPADPADGRRHVQELEDVIPDHVVPPKNSTIGPIALPVDLATDHSRLTWHHVHREPASGRWLREGGEIRHGTPARGWREPA